MTDLRKAAQQLKEEEPRALTQQENLVFRRALLNSSRVISFGKLVEPAGAEDMKVYAAIADGYNKRQRKPLTKEEIKEFTNGLNGIHPPISRQRRDLLLVRVAEAAHGIGGDV